MGDDIDRSNWTEQDHQAERLGRDLTEIATGRPAGRAAAEVPRRTFAGFLRLLVAWFTQNKVIGGVFAVVLVLLVAVAAGVFDGQETPAAPAERVSEAGVTGGDVSGATAAVSGDQSPTTDAQPQNTSTTTTAPGSAFGVTNVDATFGSYEEAEDAGVYSELDYVIKDPLPGIENFPMLADLVDGEVHVVLDFDAMTAAGSFSLAYQCDGAATEYPVCTEAGEGFAGTAVGSFSDLAIIPAPTSATPPDFWTLPAEDWLPGLEDSWYIYGPVAVELDFSGTLASESADDHTSTSAVYAGDILITRDGNSVTGGWYQLYVELPENDTWVWNLFLQRVLEQPLPDPLL
jgi:hypothetical protein